ncbi:hypothetical protein CEXT_303081 [Caerostris extrusa]|uniref:GIY-YIG homing endonuclease n=1 Tax=Caerostris extrusa TaxID=172846 RepID=A0AAV4MW97_CAEEX|nr:hypothetical protein CEXT_303081 [Caerostris extrusa]
MISANIRGKLKEHLTPPHNTSREREKKKKEFNVTQAAETPETTPPNTRLNEILAFPEAGVNLLLEHNLTQPSF